MFTPRTHCRACGLGKPSLPTLKHSTAAGTASQEQKLIEVLDLGLMPLANDFVGTGEEQAGYAPLKLMWCPRCTLAQLSVVVNPKVLYGNYPYITSHSQTMNHHFCSLATDLMSECAHRSVVEIGSNDGSLLKFLLGVGFKNVLGIEPAKNIADLANKSVPTWNAFFNRKIADDIVRCENYPDLIIARHVFCHIDDWQETISGIERIMNKNTVVAIEVPHFYDTVKNGEWDQIYHEHLSYMTIEAMQAALECSCLHISKVNHYPIHGGAIVMIIRRDDCGIEPSPLPAEKVSLDDLRVFASNAHNQIKDLTHMVKTRVAQGQVVVGYGASAKATQWIQACGFTRKHLKFVCDETPQKQYKFMPGSDIPVADPGALTRELPDYAVNFAWNFSREIMEKETIFKAKGGKWIVPVPEVMVYGEEQVKCNGELCCATTKL